MTYSADPTPWPNELPNDSPTFSPYEGPHYSGMERRVSLNDATVNPNAGFGRRQSDNYLDSMIASASPARLRLMLIEKGVEVARHLSSIWRETPGKRGTNEHSLKLFELLSELLSGVTDKNVEVCRTVADMYVFLCQHLIGAEENGDATMIDEIRLVLETEAETWRMVCAQEGGQSSPQSRASALLGGGSSSKGTPSASGLNLQG